MRHPVYKLSHVTVKAEYSSQCEKNTQCLAIKVKRDKSKKDGSVNCPIYQKANGILINLIFLYIQIHAVRQELGSEEWSLFPKKQIAFLDFELQA